MDHKTEKMIKQQMSAVPAIDLIDGKMVRLFRGNYRQQTIYPASPLEYARQIDASGLERLHLVDLSGARAGKLMHISFLREICRETSLKVDFGGGVKSLSDVEEVLNAGASQVVLGSLCVLYPEMVRSWLTGIGAGRFILALDIDGSEVKINAWQSGSGRRLEEVLSAFSDFDDLTVLVTDIRRDGTAAGASVTLYNQLVSSYPNIRWIASGGVNDMDDLRMLGEAGCAECVIGKAVLENRLELTTLKKFNDGSI